MKSRLLLLIAVVLATTLAASGADVRTEAILRLLNSRSSSSLRTYATAAAAVAEGARSGDRLSQYVIAVLSESADWPASERLASEVRKNYRETSEPHIRTLAETEGNAFAWYLLYLGEPTEDKLQKAVDGGNVQALNAAGTARLTAALSNPDAADAAAVKTTCFGYFKTAAEKGDANGLNNLAICYQNGWGCEKDEAQALACFRKAAQQGHAEAVNNLGRFFREGIVVKKDLSAALRCFRLSAGQGNVSGQLNYTLALIRGEGVPADPDKGVKLLEAMAARGQVEAMDCLSECYLKGVGALKADAMKSIVWMLRARAARGDGNAAEWLKENDEAAHDR